VDREVIVEREVIREVPVERLIEVPIERIVEIEVPVDRQVIVERKVHPIAELEQIGRLEGEIDRLRVENTRLDFELSARARQPSPQKITDEERRSFNTIKDLENEVQRLHHDLGAARHEVTYLKSRRSNTASELMNIAEKFDNIRSDHLKLETEHGQVIADCERLKHNQDQLEAELNCTRIENEKLMGARAELEVELSTLHAECDHLKVKLSGYDQYLDEMPRRPFREAMPPPPNLNAINL
jgi:chromosome segregation ATPase